MDETVPPSLMLRQRIGRNGFLLLLCIAALITGCAGSKIEPLDVSEIVGLWVGIRGVPLRVPPGPNPVLSSAPEAELEAITRDFNSAAVAKSPFPGAVTRSLVFWFRDGRRLALDVAADGGDRVRATLYRKDHYKPDSARTLESRSLVAKLQSLATSPGAPYTGSSSAPSN